MQQALWPMGQQVRLHSFNHTLEPPVACKPAENYWLLIGYIGHVIGYHEARQRYLIQFEASILNLGLHSHNSRSNSLFILADDLTPLNLPESVTDHEC